MRGVRGRSQHPFEGEQIYLFHCRDLEREDSRMMLRAKIA